MLGHVGGRFLFAYQVMGTLAVYQMVTAILVQLPRWELPQQTKAVLSSGRTNCVTHNCSFIAPEAVYSAEACIGYGRQLAMAPAADHIRVVRFCCVL